MNDEIIKYVSEINGYKIKDINKVPYINLETGEGQINSMSEFKTWLLTDNAPTGVFIARVFINSNDTTAVVEKLNNDYLSFIHFGYGFVLTQYEYTNNSWKNYTEMDLINNHEILLAELTGDTSIISNYYGGNIAWDFNSKWFKCFIYFDIAVTSGATKTITIPLPNGFIIPSNYNINNVVTIFNKDTGVFVGMSSLNITTTGISITIPDSITGNYLINASPYLYYNEQLEN